MNPNNCKFKRQSCTTLCPNPKVEIKSTLPKLPNYKQRCKVSRNLMWDPHVYRGTTFITSKQAEKERCKKLEECKRREKIIRGRGGLSCCPTFVDCGQCGYDGGGNGDGDGRLTIGDLLPSYKRYLEEVDDGQEFAEKKEVTMNDRGTQTEDQLLVAMQMASLKHPCHVKVKSGIEVSTGMDKNDDTLTKCLSEQLACEMISKIVDQSMLELIQEEDMGQMSRSQNCYKSYKIPIDIKRREIEDHEQCLNAQKEKMAAILEAQMDLEEEVADSINARYFAKSFLANLAKNAVDILEAEGFLTDSFKNDIQGQNKSGANTETQQEMCCTEAARIVVDDIINQVSCKKQKDHEILQEVWQYDNNEKKNPDKISIVIKPAETETETEEMDFDEKSSINTF